MADKGEAAPSVAMHIRFCYYFLKCVESMSDNQFMVTVKAAPPGQPLRATHTHRQAHGPPVWISGGYTPSF